MVEHQPSKLDTWVRFPSPASARVAQGWSTTLPRLGSRVRIPSRAFIKKFFGNFFFLRDTPGKCLPAPGRQSFAGRLFSSEQRRGIISIPAVRQQDCQGFPLIFRSFRDLHRRVKRGSRRNSGQDSLQMGQFFGHCKANFIVYRKHLIVNRLIQHRGHKSRADPLNLVRAAFSL